MLFRITVKILINYEYLNDIFTLFKISNLEKTYELLSSTMIPV